MALFNPKESKMDINAIIAEASVEAQVQPASQEEAKSEVVQDKPEGEVTDPASAEEDISKKPDDELTPEQLAKRERNRQSHLNSKLAQQRRINRELEAKLSQTEQSKMQPQSQDLQNGKPDINRFAKFEEYTDAYADWILEQKLSAQTKKTEETQKTHQVDLVKTQRAQEISAHEAEFAKQAPEYETLLGQNQEFFSPQNLKNEPEIVQGLLDTDNPTLALFALMKEGRLNDLYDLSPTKLAAELAKAEIRGESYLKQTKPTTNAPAPLSPARGNASGSKPFSSSMSWPEMKKELNLK